MPNKQQQKRKTGTKREKAMTDIKEPGIAMEDPKKIRMRILQEIFEEYKRECYFSPKTKLELKLNVVLYDESGNWTDTISMTAVFDDNLEKLHCRTDTKRYAPVMPWYIILKAIHTERWKITSYGIYEKEPEIKIHIIKKKKPADDTSKTAQKTTVPD